MRCLEQGVALSDASAYNVRFLGPKPIFIDSLSFRGYWEDEFWTGHKQFCEQFLNPLLLRALLGVPHNAWYRGGLEGIPTAELNRLLPLHRKLSWDVLTNVVMAASFQRTATGGSQAEVPAAGSSRGCALASDANMETLADLSGAWMDRIHDRKPPRGIILDMDSSESPTHGEQEGSAWNGHVWTTPAAPGMSTVGNEFDGNAAGEVRP